MIRLNRSLMGRLLTVGALTVGLSACAVVEVFENEKRAPDEFAVYARPPLNLPPDYGLRPPAPDEDDLLVESSQEQALAALTGTGRRPVQQQPLPNTSPGVQALLNRAGANQADPNIREALDAELGVVTVSEENWFDTLIFWVDDKQDPGVVLDAQAEQRRLLESQALGRSINEGEVPEITRKRPRKGILEGLF